MFGSSKPASQQLKLQYHLVHQIKFKNFPCSTSKMASLNLCVEKALGNPVCKHPPNRALINQILVLSPLPATIATATASPAKDVMRRLNIPFDRSE